MPPLTAAQRRLQRVAMQLFAERGVTRLTVSELAHAAGIARGTIYNNLPDVDHLFSEVAKQLADDLVSEMIEVATHASAAFGDPARRVANGIRYFVKRAHDDPVLGRFFCRFGMSTDSLQKLWTGQPARDLNEGLDSGRFCFDRDQLVSVVSLTGGVVLAAIKLVLDGRKTWRDAGSDAAEFVLAAIGVSLGEARELARMDLPDTLL